MIKDLLYKPFENIDSRRGRGGTYDYIKWQNVADRMNEVFGMNWSSHVCYQEVIEGNLIIRVSVCAKDPQSGEEFCQEGYGGSVMRSSDEPGTAHKGAYSKALKDACKKWGVGLHLDGDDSKPVGSNPPSGFMGHATGNSSPAAGGFAPTTNSNQSPIPNTAPAVNTGPVPNQAPVTPAVNTGPVPGNSAPPSGPAPAAAVTQAPAISPMSMAPPIPSGNVGMAPTPTTPELAQATPQPTNTVTTGPDPDAVGTLTDVQEIAITHMASMKNANGEEAIVQLITNSQEIGLTRPISKIKDLSYNEAVSVIKTIKNL